MWFVGVACDCRSTSGGSASDTEANILAGRVKNVGLALYILNLFFELLKNTDLAMSVRNVIKRHFFCAQLMVCLLRCFASHAVRY
jgi:hypothetical protein